MICVFLCFMNSPYGGLYWSYNLIENTANCPRLNILWKDIILTISSCYSESSNGVDTRI